MHKRIRELLYKKNTASWDFIAGLVFLLVYFFTHFTLSLYFGLVFIVIFSLKFFLIVDDIHKKYTKKQIISLIIFIIIFTGIIIVLFQKKEGIVIGRYIFFAANGDSMCPTIGEKAIILIKKSNDIKLGDIVLIRNAIIENQIITHRIIDKFNFKDSSENFYVSKGDCNSEDDGVWIRKEQILGKTIFNIDLISCVCDNKN